MFERSPVAQAVIDRELRILVVNAAFCSLMGYGRDRLLGMKITDFKSKGLIKYLTDTADSCTNVLSQKRDFNFESAFETSSGVHYMLQSCQPVLDGDGEIKFIYNSYMDITVIEKNREYMGREVDEFIAAYEKMGEGDLTISHAVEKPKDLDLHETYEILAKLRSSVRTIISNLQVNIRDVNKRMLNLTTSAETASRSLGDATKSVQQVALDAQKVSENAERASQGMDQISKAMQDMSASVEEITSSMDSVSVLSRETNDLSQKGAQLAGKAEQSMGEISSSSEKVYSIVIDVEKQMGDITKIVGLIRDLANQTNLLALNAAIEAARAGDAGRGFAVVATEVKSLAQESRNSAERIEEMIANLKKNTQNASRAMGEAKGVVDQGSRMVAETMESFNRIAAAIDKVAKSASEVAAATQEQAATTQEITASVHEVTSLINETVKESADAASATEESFSALEEITSVVKNVSTLANEALEANRKFKVD
ncbi:MAG: methyl-accepting chemotaxis protein [Methanoregulaceae archaeon]